MYKTGVKVLENFWTIMNLKRCTCLELLLLDSLQQSDLASRLTLNCQQNKVDVTRLQHIAITLMDVYDDYALSYHVQETLCELYPKAKRATLKSGGNFPYLSRTDDCTLHLQIHLRLFEDTPYSAKVTGEEVASCS
uniref:Maspardin n=1 Tax=Cacopsylla melanoneura TaxID=428564 RepID=A0A8D8ZQ00_9HEMI